MKYLWCLLVCFCLTLSPVELCSQNFSEEQVMEDLKFLRDRIETYNPGIKLFTPSFSSTSDSLLGTCHETMSKFDVYKKAAQLTALSHEGHYSLGNSSDSVHYGLWNDVVPFFPLSVIVIENGIYVYFDLSEEFKLKKGDQLLSINGKPAEEIVIEMISCIPTDGVIPTYPRRRLTQRFPWLYHMVVEQSSSFKLEVLPYGKSKKTNLTLQALPSSKRIENYKERYAQPRSTDSMSDFYELEFKRHSAILTLKSFDWRLIDKYDIEASAFYEKIFTEIQKNSPEKLIIDLRDNTGGRHEFAYELVPFIRRQDLEIKYLSESVSWKGKSSKRKVKKRSSLAFDGQIIALINGLSYSNGSVLPRYLREYGGAKIVGEESGTRYEGFVAGSQEMITLPNARLEIGIPRYAKKYPDSNIQTTTNRGLIPDVEIPLTLELIMTEEDEVLDYALGL